MDPVVEVGWLHADTLRRTLVDVSGGVIAVIGGSDIERRKIAETLAAKRVAIKGESHYAIRLFDTREADPRVHNVYYKNLELETVIRKEDPDVICAVHKRPKPANAQNRAKASSGAG